LETAKANKATEDIRAQNLELEAALTPRVFNQVTVNRAMKDTAPIPIFIVGLPDAEPRNLQNTIATVFDSFLHWPVTILPPTDAVPNGVSIRFMRQDGVDPFETPLARTANAIAQAMGEFGMEVSVSFNVVPRFVNAGVTPGALLFMVGANPKLTRLAMPKEIRERMREIDERIRQFDQRAPR
jgi:hypothetical protein